MRAGPLERLTWRSSQVSVGPGASPLAAAWVLSRRYALPLLVSKTKLLPEIPLAPIPLWTSVSSGACSLALSRALRKLGTPIPSLCPLVSYKVIEVVLDC